MLQRDELTVSLPDPAMQPTVLAIDIGATKLAVGLISSDGTVLSEERTPNPGEVTAALEALKSLSGQVVQNGLQQFGFPLAIGIACGGPLDRESGVIQSPPNLPDWDEVPLTDIFAQQFGVPAYLENDATAGAVASYLWDNPDRVENLLYVTVSSGIGSGVIAGGVALGADSGNGGELGHIPLVYGGRACTCGLSGCAEAYVSGHSISARFLERDSTTFKQTSAPPSAKEIANLADAGDPNAISHWNESMLMLRRVLRAGLDVYAPDLLIVGGGVTEAPEYLFKPALAVDEERALLGYPPNDQPIVRITGFGRNSGVTAAGAVAWHQHEGGRHLLTPLQHRSRD